MTNNYVYPVDEVKSHNNTSPINISNTIGDEFIIPFPFESKDLLNVKSWDSVSYSGPSNVAIKESKSGNIIMKVMTKNATLKDYEFLINLIIVTNSSTPPKVTYKITQSAIQPADGEAIASEKLQEQADKVRNDLENNATNICKAGVEKAQQAIGGTITGLIPVTEDMIDNVLKSTLGFDVTINDAVNACKKAKDSYEKSQESEKKLRKKVEEYKARQAEGKRINIEKLAAIESQLAQLEAENKKTAETIEDPEDKKEKLTKELLEKAKKSSIGAQLYKDIDNIKIQGGVLSDASKQLGKSVASAATEGIGATGTAGPYPAAILSPSPTQLTGTAMRLASAGKTLSPPILSISQSAARLGLSQDKLEPLNDIAAALSIVSTFSL